MAIRFDEKPLHPTSSIVATGIYVLPQRVFPILSRYCSECKQDNLGSFVSYLLAEDDVYAYVFSEIWRDIGDEIMQTLVSV